MAACVHFPLPATLIPTALSGTVDDDLVLVIDDSDEAAQDDESLGLVPWYILIADDDPSVHEATVAALAGQRVHGRPLRFLHTHSAAETVSLLAETRAVDLVLLDVVMETPDAGLRAVPEIRERLGRRDLKIIIRTGQPGHAPEHEIRREYAIDGYAKKAELTRGMLRDVIATTLQPDGTAPAGAH